MAGEAQQTESNQEEEEREEVEETLTLKQELFCKIYASDREFFGNGVESYAEAYNIDQSKPNWYRVAQASAARLLKNTRILKRIDEIMPQLGFNDADVDRQLSFVIHQDAELGAKVQAIREYNKLKKRIQDKLDITTNGEKISVNIISYGTNAAAQVQPPPVPAPRDESTG